MNLHDQFKSYAKIMEDSTAFRELSDSPVLEPGNTEIWYVDTEKKDNMRNFGMGWDWLVQMDEKEPGRVTIPDANNLEATHIKLGTIGETDLHRIFRLMQGETWSPQGEARQLIASKDLWHTSMMVGDIIVVNGNAMMVDDYGFVNIATGEKVD